MERGGGSVVMMRGGTECNGGEGEVVMVRERVKCSDGEEDSMW